MAVGRAGGRSGGDSAEILRWNVSGVILIETMTTIHGLAHKSNNDPMI